MISYVPKDKKGVFSLGSLGKLAGIRKEDIQIEARHPGATDKTNSYSKKVIVIDKHFLSYMNEVFRDDAFWGTNRIEYIKQYLYHFKTRVGDIAANLRNPASHDSVMPFWKAVYCGNTIFMQDNLLQDFLRKIKPQV